MNETHAGWLDADFERVLYGARMGLNVCAHHPDCVRASHAASALRKIADYANEAKKALAFRLTPAEDADGQ